MEGFEHVWGQTLSDCELSVRVVIFFQKKQYKITSISLLAGLCPHLSEELLWRMRQGDEIKLKQSQL